MMLLDTNVLSEFMRQAPDPRVVGWLDQQPRQHVWVCAISRAEIELGIALLDNGRKKHELAEKAGRVFQQNLAGRSLSFDDSAAVHYARIIAARRRAGVPISVEDAQIAAIAASNGLCVATRNDADFRGIEGLAVINPWKASEDNGG